jgi:uncharacterized radical SAM superfamily protein
MERAKKALVSKQRHLMTMEHRRGGTYISNQVRMHACHLTSKHCTHIFYRKIIKKKKQKKQKKIIELIIKENHCCDLGTERKMRRTLPLENFQKKKNQCECKGRSPMKIDHDEHVWAGRP